MSKTAVAENVYGSIAAGDYVFSVTDPTSFKTLKMDGGENSLLALMRQNYAEDGWEPVFNGGAQVLLHNTNRTVTIAEVGTYSLQGEVAGTITIWTEEI